MKKFSIFFGVVMLFPFFSVSQIFVNATTGNDSNDGLTAATAKQTINAGITAATAGQTVFIATGTYAGCTLNKSVNLQGDGIGLTIILGGGSGNGINITTSISNVVISDLSVNNFARGVFVNNASISLTNLTLQNIALSNNTSFGFRVSNANSINNLQVINCEMNNNSDMGFSIATVSSGLNGLGISGSKFNLNGNRGVSLGTEQISNILLNNVSYKSKILISNFLQKKLRVIERLIKFELHFSNI